MASIVIDSTSDPELFATVLGLLSGGNPEPAEAVEAPKRRRRKKPEPEPEPEPAQSADDELKELTEAVVSNLNAGHVTRSDLAQLLASFDVKKLTDLHESRYAEFRTAFLALL